MKIYKNIHLNSEFILFKCLTYPVAEDFYKQAYTVKPVYNGHSQKDQNLFFKTNQRLLQVKCIAESSKRSILQYFRPSLCYHLSLRSLFCLFLGWPLKTGFMTRKCHNVRLIQIIARERQNT